MENDVHLLGTIVKLLVQRMVEARTSGTWLRRYTTEQALMLWGMRQWT